MIITVVLAYFFIVYQFDLFTYQVVYRISGLLTIVYQFADVSASDTLIVVY